MKAYIIKLVLEDSKPLIWRRVVMPAGATFNRLHDVIQGVTNFSGDGHLYAFYLHEEGIVVTNDEEAYEEYTYLKKNKKEILEQLKARVPENQYLVQLAEIHERLKTIVRKPSGLKIDEYLERHGTVDYRYDYGDGWQFTVTLEEIVKDYYFGYPTLLDGKVTAPPEDVGGLDGFKQFLAIYKDPDHPEHEETVAWATSQNFQQYDKEKINSLLKFIQYQKTEWDKIDHQNYVIVEDKYREND
ncbi:plasmid pRiA4b ORF-3 family protein [Lacticigenium naphthae]|uniref:plasmid pRiA4b ORF-3 family protein n=1 Tax=Lacticigenium naphthae TaxID=515351 RepID=UPI0003FBA05D|nr:plasmid pRiA4b ORF-3 family protein [Lacticigenium naphthae]